jgi:Transposase zinc-ribbon domain/ISXO2-like transposase domain
MKTEPFPRTLTEFEARFSDEEACLKYLREVKWPEGFRCSRCEGRASWFLERRCLEECTACGKQHSLTAGTIFEGTRKPIRMWFRAITLFVTSKRSLSAKELSRQLELHYETAWTWLHKLRRRVGTAFGTDKLVGTVEVHAFYLGGTDDRAHQHRTLAGRKAHILGAVEVKAGHLGRIRLERCHSEKSGNIQRFVRRHVEKRAAVLTRSNGKTKTKASLPRVFSNFKRLVLGTFHGSLSHKHLPAYLDEFEFRFNRRTSSSRWLLFQRVLEAAPKGPPVTLRALTLPVVGP